MDRSPRVGEKALIPKSYLIGTINKVEGNLVEVRSSGSPTVLLQTSLLGYSPFLNVWAVTEEKK